MHVVENGFDVLAIQKLRDWGERLVPLDLVAGDLLQRLFSEEGLELHGQQIQRTEGSSKPCFAGVDPNPPITIQAHNYCLGNARKVFARERGDDTLLLLSGHSMRRTAVHLFEKYRVPPSYGMELTGHKTIETYMKYASRPSPRDLRRCACEAFGLITFLS